MTRLFLTKTWGFSPRSYPVLGFSRGGGRDKFLREATSDDWVAVIGTTTAPTIPEERGRLLGRMRLNTRRLVSVEQVLCELGTDIPEDHYNEDGSYKWPEGLVMLEAERFEPMPRVRDVLGHGLPGFHWVSYALDAAAQDSVGPAGVDAILACPRVAVPVTPVPTVLREAAIDRVMKGQRSFGPTGPPPSFSSSGCTRTEGEGVAYLLQLQRQDRRGSRAWSPVPVFKVGKAADLDQRLATLNKEIRPGITSCRWVLRRFVPFETERQAYAFEQAVIAALRRRRVEGERECFDVAEREVAQRWENVLFDGAWAGGGWSTKP